MKEQLRWILNQMLEDAQQDDPDKRFYKLSDKDLIASINSFAEYFQGKQNRTSAEGVGTDTKIQIEYVTQNDSSVQTAERDETNQD